MIGMNNGAAVSSNSQFNGWNAPPRATMFYTNDGKIGFKKLKDINPIKDITDWAIGGFMVKPYMDFKNERIPSGVNYKTHHTYIGNDGEYIYLIVKPHHMIRDIIPILDKLNITQCIVLDGGGSSQLRHPKGQFNSTRRIGIAVLLKEI